MVLWKDNNLQLEIDNTNNQRIVGILIDVKTGEIYGEVLFGKFPCTGESVQKLIVAIMVNTYMYVKENIHIWYDYLRSYNEEEKMFEYNTNLTKFKNN